MLGVPNLYGPKDLFSSGRKVSFPSKREKFTTEGQVAKEGNAFWGGGFENRVLKGLARKKGGGDKLLRGKSFAAPKKNLRTPDKRKGKKISFFLKGEFSNSNGAEKRNKNSQTGKKKKERGV